MKYYEKVLVGAIKANYKKCVSLLLIVAFVLSIIPLTVNASNEEPQIGGNENAADYMSVTNNDVDYTANFRNTKEINIAANTRGSFDNIRYTGNVYYYSADIYVESDSSSYGSIRMILGTCTYSAYKRYIEVCIRPNLDGQAVFFLNGSGLNTSGEYAVKVHGPTNVKVGDTYRCTVKYDNGKISFWVDGALIFDSVALPDKTRKIAPAAGFYSQNCEGKISNVSIWGDVEKIEDISFDETVKPVFDNEKDINSISDVLITDNVNGTTYKCSDCEVKSESTSTNRPVFSNILWNSNTYNLSFDAVKYDTAEKDWEGLIFKVATALKDGEEYDVEIRIRSGAAILFTRDKKNAETAYDIIGCPSPYAVTNNYTIYYKDNNKLYLWKDDTAVFKGLDLTKYGYSDIKPAISLGGEVCAFSYTNIKLWGEGITVMNEPQFNPEIDTNAVPDAGIAGNNIGGITFDAADCSLKNETASTSRLNFTGVTYDKVYNFSTKAVMHDNKNLTSGGGEINWEGLIFGLGTAKKDSADYKIEVRVRNSGIHIFAVKDGGGEEVIESVYGFSTSFESEYNYTVVFKEDGSFDFWQNSASVFYNYKIANKGFEDFTPMSGLGGEVCSFDFKEMKLWGQGMTVTKEPEKIEPEFNGETDENVIPDTAITGKIFDTTFNKTDCSITNKADTTTRLGFSGITYGKSYYFSTNATLYDNKTLTGNGTEYSWEGLIFSIGKAVKDSTHYTIEIRVRNGGVHIFAVKEGGGEELVKSVFDIPAEFGKEIKYTVAFKEDGSIEFWHGGKPVIYDYKLSEKGFDTLTPEFGLGGEVCSFDFKEMKLWGQGMTVTKEPEKIEPVFNKKTDKNVIPDTAITGKIFDTTFNKKDCLITNKADTTTRLGFSGITYGKSYYFSTNATLYDNKTLTGNGTEYSWEGLIFSIGKAVKDSTHYTIEIRVRNGGVHIFAVKEGGGEELVKSVFDIPAEFGKEIKYTVAVKEDGTIEFWHGGKPVIYGYKLSENGFNEITNEFGLGGEVCSFDFKEMKLWGQGMTVTKEPEKIEPVFNKKTDKNVIPDTAITGKIFDTTFNKKDCSITNKADTTTRLGFSGITYGKSYYFSTNATLYDNKTLTGDGTEYSWEGLIFSIGKAVKDSTHYTIEIRVRNGGVHIFAVKEEGGEDLVETFSGITTEFGKAYKYTVAYNKDGSIEFWHSGKPVIYGYKLSEKGYAKLTPEFGLGGEVCSFDFKEMKLWGQGMTVTKEPEKIEPIFNKKTDTNIIPQVVISNSTSGKASRPKNYSVSSNANTTSRMAFSGITYGKSYYFSTNATMYNNKTLTESGSEYSWEGLIFSLGKAKKGSDEYTIEIRVRNGGVIIFAVKKGGGEEVVDSFYGIATEFGKEYKYTVAYNKDGSIEFWHSGKPVIYGYKLNEKGFSSLVPDFGSGGEVCSFDLKNMKLWGEVTVQTAPKYDSSTMEDLIPDVVVNDVFSGKLYKLTDRVLKNTTQNTGRVNFAGVKVNGDYTFFAEIKFEDNKNITSDKREIDWEGIIFRVAKAKKNNKTYTIEVRVRHKNILVYAVDDDGKETLVLNQGLVSEYGKALPYVLEYKSGEITLWRDDIKLLDSFRPNDYGYTDIAAFMGIGCEVCNFKFSDMHLVNKFASKDRAIPQMPESNGDYGTVTEVSENSVISFTDGVLSCSSDKSGEKVFFQYLPFKTNDTYVFGCDVTVTKAEQSWMGPRFIFGKNSKGEEIALFFTESSLMVTEGGVQKYTLTLKRELGTKYRFDMLVEPTGLSVWVNDILLIDNVKTSPKSEAMTGVLFENTVTTIENINLYYTSPVKFVVPKKKPKPVLKTLGANQYNAAEFAKVTLGDQDYNGYFDCKLISNDNTKGLRYMFKDLPIKDSQSYYYSSTFKVTQSEENWKGPRFIYRKGANVTMYCAITQTSMLLLADGAVVASSPFELELGRSYDIVIYSTPDSVSVWLDGKIVFSNIDLTAYTLNDTLSAKPGVLFELCKAQVTNIALYGDDIVFDPEFVDLELYNDKYFRMKSVPEKTENSKNLFSNIIMVDLSSGSLGASYDDETRTFKNDYSDVQSGKIRFLDANNSSNLNGLKNSSGYVFNFNYLISSTGSEEPDKNGTWFICNSSTAPYLTTNCDTRVGIFEDSLRLYVYKDGQLKSSTETEFNFVKDRDYRFNVVHGKNWIKLFVDDKLSVVVTDLPEYKVAFDFEMCNTACNINGFELYEFEDTGLEILEKEEVLSATKAGKSVNESESYNIKADTDFPIIAVIVLGVFLTASVFGGVLIIKSRKRSK